MRWNHAVGQTNDIGGLEGVKPDGGDDDEVCNDAEDGQAHVQDDHQPTLLIMMTIAIFNTSLTWLIIMI